MAGGGAGDIYSSPDLPEHVIKIYRNPADRKAYEPKIKAMMRTPPRLSPLLHNGQERHQLAWPTLIAETERGEFLGFAMPEINFGASESLERMLQKRMRAKTGLPEFFGYRIYVAHNLAASVAELHAQHHHIIDLKFHEVGLRGQRRLFQRSSRCGNTGGFDVLCSAGQSKT